MLVNNIFQLIYKFGSKEDQISAAFGFLLKNNPKILNNFLNRIKISLEPKEFRKVDIETQVTYVFGEKSKIDLQLKIYGKFLIFIESKLYKIEKGNFDDKIYVQLSKYKNILKLKKPEYNGIIKLVYINKQPIRRENFIKLRDELKLSKNEFFFFCWEDLIKLTENSLKSEIVKQFKEFVGDTMYAKQTMEEQRIKEVDEILVVFTNPVFWELAQKKNIAVQKNSAPNAQYIAFLRTHRGKGLRSGAITHIAQVKYTESYVPREITSKGFPALIEHYQKRGIDPKSTHKHYALGKIFRLSREIPLKKGEKQKGQVYFSTKMSELLHAESIGKIRTLKQLKREK